MRFTSRIAAVAAIGLMVASPVAAMAAPLHIDIPVKLKRIKVVMNVDRKAFAGKEPLALRYLMMMTQKFKHDHTKAKIVAVFSGDMGYLLTNDSMYNQLHNTLNGTNPFKGQIETLIKRGVQIEECGVTAKAHHWGNADLLPGVKVDAGAVARVLQLVQQGYIQYQP